MSAPGGAGTAVALLGYSLLTNRRDGGQVWYVVRNLGAGALLVAVARRRGLAWDAVGLGSTSAVQGMRIGLRAAAATAAAVTVGARVASGHGGGRRLLADQRAALDGRGVLWQSLVRIPIGTAAFEEVAFRGVLYGLIAARHGRRAGLLASSLTFGLWHVGPTLAALRINDIRSGRARACAAAIAVTTTAGLALGGLRISGGHVAAPWLAHWSTNALTLAASAIWQRAQGRDL